MNQKDLMRLAIKGEDWALKELLHIYTQDKNGENLIKYTLQLFKSKLMDILEN